MKHSKTNRRMSDIERDAHKTLTKAKKDADHIRRKLSTTLKWIDVQDVSEKYVMISNGKSSMLISGIKLCPHNIFIDDEIQQERWITNLRFCLNNLTERLWYGFVYSPVNCDAHINSLNDAMAIEEDPVCKRMIRNDLQKIYSLQNDSKEREFFVLIRDEDEQKLNKRLQDLFAAFRSAQMQPQYLNRRDYYSYLMFVFENTLINDYVFSRGLFSYLNMKEEYDALEDKYIIKNYTEDFSAYGNPIMDIRPDANMIRKSKLAPTYFANKGRWLEVGDRYIQNLLVTSLPQNYYLGLLCDYMSYSDVKVFLTTSKSSDDLMTYLNKDLRDKERQYDKAKDETDKKRILVEIESLHQYIDDITRKSDKTLDVTLVFQISGSSKQELDERKRQIKSELSNSGFRLHEAQGLQEELFRFMTPLFIDDGLSSIMRENISLPMTTDGIAGLWPFVFETLDDQFGWLLGYEYQTGGKIFLDPYAYLRDHQTAVEQQRNNCNFVVVGGAGSGKTTATSIVTRYLIEMKSKIIWIDPENKNKDLTRLYKGTYVEWGQKGNMINPFDLKPISTDDGDPDWESKMWDTQLAIYNVIDDINMIFQYLYPNIEEDVLAITGDIVLMAFKAVGIQPDQNGIWPSFKGMNKEDYPTFTTFNNCLMKCIDTLGGKGDTYTDKLLNNLSVKMRRIMNEWSIYLNGHTTIDDSYRERKIVSFGTKQLMSLPETLQNALNHIMFMYSWSQCLEAGEYSAFIVDEAHTLISKGKTANLLAQFVRRSRKYWNAMFIITQEPRDFADEKVLTDGKAIFNNSAYKIIMNLNKDASDELEKLQNLNENEKFWIQMFGQGEGLLLLGTSGMRRIPIKVWATKEELSEMGAMFR